MEESPSPPALRINVQLRQGHTLPLLPVQVVTTAVMAGERCLGMQSVAFTTCTEQEGSLLSCGAHPRARAEWQNLAKQSKVILQHPWQVHTASAFVT